MAKIIEVEIKGLEELKQQFAKLGNEAMPRMKFGFLQFLSTVADAARIKVSVKSGHLQSSITHQISKETSTELEGRVGSNVKYAPYVELGTGIYGSSGSPIRPKNAKVLAWTSVGPRPTTKEGWAEAVKEGRAVFAREVSGQKPRAFLLPALNENISKLVEILKKVLS